MTRTSTDNCAIWGRQPETNEKWCLISCKSLPSDWPEKPYLAPNGECVQQCEQVHDTDCRSCADMDIDGEGKLIWDPIAELCVADANECTTGQLASSVLCGDCGT